MDQENWECLHGSSGRWVVLEGKAREEAVMQARMTVRMPWNDPCRPIGPGLFLCTPRDM